MTRAGGPPGPRAKPPEGGGAESMGSILRRLAGELRLDERRREAALAALFGQAAGTDLAAKARVAAFRAGVLTVEVEGAARLDEVRRFRAHALLEAVRAMPGGERVREIRFVPAGRSRT